MKNVCLFLLVTAAGVWLECQMLVAVQDLLQERMQQPMDFALLHGQKI